MSIQIILYLRWNTNLMQLFRKVYYIIFTLLLLSSAQLLCAQDDDNFDFFEDVEKDKDIDLFHNSKRNSLTRRRDETNAYFLESGNVIVSGGLYFQNTPRAVGAPGSFGASATIVPNISLGFVYATYRFKGYEYIDSSTRTTTEWQSNSLKVRHNFYGIKGVLHLSHLININYSLFDVYIKGVAGVNTVNGKTEILKEPEEYYETFRWYLAAGVRYFYDERFSVFIDLGKNGYGLVNFGVSYRIITTN